MFVDTTALSLLCPEIVLIFVAAFMFVAGAFRPEPRWWMAFAPLTLAAVLGLVLLGIEWPYWQTLGRRNQWTAGPVSADSLGQWVRLGTLAVGLAMCGLISSNARRRLTAEVLGLYLLILAGVMFVCRANDLVLLFVGLELVSIPTYILLFLARRDRGAAESTVKYFFLSVLSSALLLYGLSFLYGLTGTTLLMGDADTLGIRELLAARDNVMEGRSLLLATSIVLMLAGIGFKVAAVPFHFYAPDVYQGTSNAMAALLSVTPKIAGFVTLVKLFVMTLPPSAFAWQLVTVLAGLTMTLGNISALWQTNVRRMLAYSSIAHSGYLLVGVAVALGSDQAGTEAGITGMVFYLATYCFGSIAIFGALAYLGDESRSIDDVATLAGLNRAQPWAAGVLAMGLFSLAGIPIFAGFWGKLSLFLGALQAGSGAAPADLQIWFIGLAVLTALNAAIAAGYYLRVIGVMYFQPATTTVAAEGGWGALASMAAGGILVVGLGVAPKYLDMGSRQAAEMVVERGERGSDSRESLANAETSDSQLAQGPPPLAQP